MRQWNFITRLQSGLLLLISGCFFVSCEERHAFEKNLVKNDSFWYLFEYDNAHHLFVNTNYGYLFHENGKSDYMYFNLLTQKMTSFTTEDVLYSNQWHYNGRDSIFVVQDFKYKMTSYSQDTIQLRFVGHGTPIDRKIKLINLHYNKKPSLKPVR